MRGSAYAVLTKYNLRVPSLVQRERGGGQMIPVAPDPMPGKMSQRDYLSRLNDIAMYAATRGSPLFLPRHITFLVTYMSKWQKLQPGPDSQKAALEVLFHGAPKWAEHLSSRLVRARIHRRVQLTLLFVWLAVNSLLQFVWSGVNNARDIVKKGIRSVPPLVTAVVVVFVTSDAWRIFGTGFTLRFFILVTAFLLASLLYLIRKDWWADVSAGEDEVEDLLKEVKHRNGNALNDFMSRGAKPFPLERPRGLSGAYGYLAYLALVAFSLIAVAIFVSGILVFVGLILVNKDETTKLAGSAYIYQSFPGIAVTKQLLSLSFSLGAFAAFFLVAAQRSEDRDVFMKDILARYRRALLVYTTYCQAHDFAEEWTGIPVKLKLCTLGTLEPHPQEDLVGISGRRAYSIKSLLGTPLTYFCRYLGGDRGVGVWWRQGLLRMTVRCPPR